MRQPAGWMPYNRRSDARRALRVSCVCVTFRLSDTAAGKGDVDAIQRIAEAHPEALDWTNWEGNTPLHHAARSNHGRAVSALLRLGADPSLSNQEGRLPADLARGHLVERLQAAERSALDVESDGEVAVSSASDADASSDEVERDQWVRLEKQYGETPTLQVKSVRRRPRSSSGDAAAPRAAPPAKTEGSNRRPWMTPTQLAIGTSFGAFFLAKSVVDYSIDLWAEAKGFPNPPRAAAVAQYIAWKHDAPILSGLEAGLGVVLVVLFPFMINDDIVGCCRRTGSGMWRRFLHFINCALLTALIT